MDDKKQLIFYETYDQELMAGVYGEVLWQGHGDHFSEGFSPFAFISLFSVTIDQFLMVGENGEMVQQG